MARLFAKTSILACLALTNLMAQTNNPAAGYWFKRGINDENVRNRLHAFSLALQYDPDFVEAQYQLARAFGEQKDDKKAELNCLKAYSKTQSQPVHDTLVVQILVELGNIYERLAKWQELETVLRKAKSISQDGLQQKTILLKLAGILYAQKRFSHALAEFENDTLPGDMPNTLAHSNSSQPFLKKMVEEKIAKIRSEINRERKNREQDKRLQKKIKTDFALGAAAIHRRHWEKAIRAFQNVLLMDRNHHEARKQLLVARSALKKDKAYGLLRNYFTELDSLYDLAQNFHKNNDARQYLGTLEKIQAIAPGYRNVNDLRRRALKNRQSSQHGTGRILPLPNDHSSGLLRWVGYVLVCLVALIFAWIKFSPFARAQLYWKIGKFDLAAKIYEKLLLQNPGRIKLYLRLAEIYLALDRRDAQALRIFKTIHKLNLQTPLQKRIGMVLARVVA